MLYKRIWKICFCTAGNSVPELYLDPEVRKGISSFSALANAEEVSQGLKKLKADIRNGDIAELINAYEHTFGDYLFYYCKKIIGVLNGHWMVINNLPGYFYKVLFPELKRA